MNEKAYILKCIQLVENKLGWGSSLDWHSDVFSELSELIFSKTGIILSITTLKRLWGKVNHDNLPSISTLNALAQFLGFKNWRDFKTKTNDRIHPLGKKPLNAKSKLFKKKTLLLSLSIIAIVSMISLVISNFNFNKKPTAVHFSSHQTSLGLPNTVVFTMDPVDSENARIQLFWDPTKTIILEKHQKTATGIYYIPGYFKAQFIIDDQSINTHDVFVKSDGWMATIDYDPIPKYIPGISNSILRLPYNAKNEVKSETQPVTTTFHYVDDLKGIDGDNFNLKSNIKVTWAEKWAVCQKVQLVILGTTGAIIIPFSIPGCTSDLNVMLNDNYVSGKKSDLSSLGLDLSDGKEIRIQNFNKTVSVFESENQLFKASYEVPMGRIIGARFRFEGLGEVSNILFNDIHLDTESLSFSPLVVSQ